VGNHRQVLASRGNWFSPGGASKLHDSTDGAPQLALFCASSVPRVGLRIPTARGASCRWPRSSCAFGTRFIWFFEAADPRFALRADMAGARSGGGVGQCREGNIAEGLATRLVVTLAVGLRTRCGSGPPRRAWFFVFPSRGGRDWGAGRGSDEVVREGNAGAKPGWTQDAVWSV